jgi:hypothetical protein
MLLSCGGSIESDAKKVAKLTCEAQTLALEAMSGDTSLAKKSQKLIEKATELKREMEQKYTSAEDREKFAKALMNEAGNCK